MDFLLWLDESRDRYWAAGLLMLALFLSAAWTPALAAPKGRLFAASLRFFQRPAVFVGLGVLAMLAFRWPVLLFPRLLDHDEAQMGAQAIKYFTDIIPWRSVDGTTSGPLNSWWLMLPRLLGGEINWCTIRVMGLVCVFGTFASTYGTLRRLGGELLARTGVLPLVFFYAFVTSYSFLHYSSEHVPVLLLSAGVYFTMRLRDGEGFSLKFLVAAALCFGAVPMAKLQPTPLAALGAMILGMIVMDRTRADAVGRKRALIAWVAAGTGISIGVLVLVTFGGALGDFFVSYPGQLISFKQVGHPKLGGFLRTDPQVFALAVGGFVTLAIIAVWCRRRFGRAMWRSGEPLPWAVAYLVLAIFCVAWTGKNYGHYFLLWVHPICLCLALFAAKISGDTDATADEGIASAATTVRTCPWLFFAPLLVVQLSQVYESAPFHPHLGRVRANLEAGEDSVVTRIKELAGPEDRMTIWGMTPSYHVDTGIPPGTRDAMSQMQILPSTRQEYYRRRYLRDMKKSRPRVFVDTDTPFLMMTGGSFVPYVTLPQHGHEVFPELAVYVRANYEEVFSVSIGDTGHRFRVYLRRDD